MHAGLLGIYQANKTHNCTKVTASSKDDKNTLLLQLYCNDLMILQLEEGRHLAACLQYWVHPEEPEGCIELSVRTSIKGLGKP